MAGETERYNHIQYKTDGRKRHLCSFCWEYSIGI